MHSRRTNQLGLLALGALWSVPSFSCGAGSRPPVRTPESQEPVVTSSAPEVTVTERMQAHFRDVDAARDALIAGDLGAAQPPLLRLANGEYGIEIPNEWLSALYEMQAEAKRGAAASTLREAALSVARIAQRCGECHQTLPGGPDMKGDEQEPTPRPETLHDTMARHRWSADELWFGLVTPAHLAWRRGARALSQAPLPMPDAADPVTRQTGEAPATSAATLAADPVDAKLAERLAAIRALGERGEQAHAAAAKAEIYGNLLAECGQCHAERRAK